MNEDKPLTVPELMELLAVSEKTVLRLLASGRLEGVKVGREWRVHREALRRFLRVEKTQ